MAGLWRTFETGLMSAAVVAVVAVGVGTYDDSLAAGPTAAGLTVDGVSVGHRAGDRLETAVVQAATASVERTLTLRAGEVEVTASARELGAIPATREAMAAAAEWGRTGSVLADLQARGQATRGEADVKIMHRFDETVALDRLFDLAPRLDRPSLPTRLDLEGRRVLPATRGSALLPYDSLSSIALALAAGRDEVELVVAHKPAVEDPLADLADELDISVALGTFETPYQLGPAHADRTHNLEVGAAALDGIVLRPGEMFSFNDRVGDRSAENGYRYAPGITAGELVDVLGGGICQVSSTLFGAAFFGGFEIERARPHSRPSSYVDMGLDSTVVYGAIDMRFRNNFDFPVALHMTVRQGKVTAEILGPARPYQVVFERTMEEAVDYETVWREDGRLRLGAEQVAQRGMRGFTLRRVRKLIKAGEVVEEQGWDLHYPATTQIIRRGTNPAGAIPKRRELPPLREPARKLRIVQ